jgi:hypothetical protein
MTAIMPHVTYLLGECGVEDVGVLAILIGFGAEVVVVPVWTDGAFFLSSGCGGGRG